MKECSQFESSCFVLQVNYHNYHNICYYGNCLMLYLWYFIYFVLSAILSHFKNGAYLSEIIQSTSITKLYSALIYSKDKYHTEIWKYIGTGSG